MNSFPFRRQGWSIAGLAAVLVVQASTAGAQAGALVDIRGLSPRQLKSQAFSLASPQDVRIEAAGAESTSRWGRLTEVARTVWQGDQRKNQLTAWSGNAWILDRKTRKVVWELSAAPTSSGARGTRVFNGTVRLPEGSYVTYYSAFPDGEYWSESDNKSDRKWHWFGDQPIEEFKIVVRGNGQRMAASDVDRLRQASARGAIVSLRGGGAEQFQQAGFALSKPTEIEVYALGEAREDGEFDYGWIISADTRAKVWKLTWRESEAAGGAPKNRVATFRRTLPAGRYAAFYATDDSHDASEWNAPPPHDPEGWGLTITVNDTAARAAVKAFAYEHVPQNATILAITRVGNGESRRQGFTLTRPMDVRVYALGEGRGGRMFDYGWITSGDSRKRVWEMRYNDTEGAGGDPKNRLVDTTIHLDKGSYVVHYMSDDSHSADDWNASAPADGRRWGITILSAQGPVDRTAIGPYADPSTGSGSPRAASRGENADTSVIAQLTEVRNDDQKRKRFTLERETDVRIHAVGEGSGGEMHDYGWIEEAKTGRRVWEMTYRTTGHAGGAAKNRLFDGTIKLPAGEYVLYFETDGSHSYGDWNAAPPDDPESWGITLYRATR
jgi:hypothetical protein